MAFTISPTTTKIDRNSMYNDLENYKKVMNGEEYVIDLVEYPEGMGIFKTKKNLEKNKVLKKQM